MPNRFFGSVSVALAMLRQTAWLAPTPSWPQHTLFLHYVFSVGLDCVITVGKKFFPKLSKFANQALNLSQFPLVWNAAWITYYSVLFRRLTVAGVCLQLPPLVVTWRLRLTSILLQMNVFHSITRCLIFLPGFHHTRMSLLLLSDLVC